MLSIELYLTGDHRSQFANLTDHSATRGSHGSKFPEGLEQEIASKLRIVESKSGRVFGDVNNPLLVSVRSGAPISMPGMMDTVLNLGLNDSTVQGLIRQTGDERFAYDAYRRFIQMFGKVVMSVRGDEFESIIRRYKESLKVESDIQLDSKTLRAIASEFKALIKERTGKVFPDDPQTQLRMAVAAQAVVRGKTTHSEENK